MYSNSAIQKSIKESLYDLKKIRSADSKQILLLQRPTIRGLNESHAHTAPSKGAPQSDMFPPLGRSASHRLWYPPEHIPLEHCSPGWQQHITL